MRNFMSYIRYFCACIAGIVICIFFVPKGGFSFAIPERLVYDLTWTGIKAGEAILEVKGGGDRLTITSRAQSAQWVSVFYTVDDRVESLLTKDSTKHGMGQPVNYRLNLREGKRKKDKEVIFYRDVSKALYIDYLTDERREYGIPSLIFDPLSSFFYLRTMHLEVGKSVYVTIFDSKKVLDVEVQVTGREKISVPAGEFQTIVIKPLMKSEGIFFSKGDIRIWLTDDGRRIPVKMKTGTGIGSITARLVGGNY